MTHSQRPTIVLASVALAVAGTVRVGQRGDPAVDRVIGELRAIHSAQATFAVMCGGGAFAASLDDLRMPPPGSPTGFISSHVGTSLPGYSLTLEPQLNVRQINRASCSGGSLVSGYLAHAEPFADQQTPSFGIREDGIIVMRRDGGKLSSSLEGAERLEQQ